MTDFNSADNDLYHLSKPKRARQDRYIDELIGLCRGISSDGLLTEKEVKYLYHWLEFYADNMDFWPACDLLPRIREMLCDGVIDDNERSELMDYIIDYVGEDGSGRPNMVTRLPLDQPEPELIFPNSNFVLSGYFAYGKREICAQATIDLGGIVHNVVSEETDYVVIGSSINKNWIHSPYGRKIEEAVALKQQGARLFIVHEQQWRKHLNRPIQQALFDTA